MSYIVIIEFLLMFSAAIGKIFDVRKAIGGGMPNLVFKMSSYGMFILGGIFLFIYFICYKKLDKYTLIIGIYLLYSLLVTYLFRPTRITEVIFDNVLWMFMYLVFYLFFSTESFEKVVISMQKILPLGTGLCIVFMIENVKIHLVSYGFSGRTISTIYYLSAFVPFFLILFSGITRYLFIILTTIMIIVSTKRAAFLIMIVGLISYYLIQANNVDKFSKKIKRFILYGLLIGVGVCFTFVFIERYNISIIDRLLNSVDDQGSGRVDIWLKVIEYFKHSDLVYKIFGHGFHAVPYEVMPMGKRIYAHNSYLEMLYDLGYIGLLFWISVIVYLLVILFKLIKNRSYFAPAFAFSLVQILLLSSLSYLFEQSVIVVPIAIFCGMTMGILKRNGRVYNDYSITNLYMQSRKLYNVRLKWR